MYGQGGAPSEHVVPVARLPVPLSVAPHGFFPVVEFPQVATVPVPLVPRADGAFPLAAPVVHVSAREFVSRRP